MEVWCVDPTSAAGRAHSRLNAKANRWRNWRAGAAERCRRQAAEIERQHARAQLLRARRGVVLATGGFVFNRSMIKQHAPGYSRGWKNGHAGCDGSGIRLGLTIGAAADGLNTVSAWRFITPPSPWMRGIVVNREGQRFCSEDLYGATIGHAMVQEQGGQAWLVLDAQLRRAAIRECLFGKLWAFQRLPALAMMMWGAKKGSNITSLAAAMGVNAATLSGEIQGYNDAAQGGQSDPQGKAPDLCQPLAQAPFYALDISIGAPLLPLATITLGGLRVREEDGQVMHQQGHVIPGLYAAGRAAIGVASHRYVSGLSLADCVFSGRRAGAAVAAVAAAAAENRANP